MNRYTYPTIVYNFQRRPPLLVEIEVRPDDVEAWNLYALLKHARTLQRNIQEVMPLLEASNLISPNPDIQSLKDFLDNLPHIAAMERDSFLHQQQSRSFYRNMANRVNNPMFDPFVNRTQGKPKL